MKQFVVDLQSFIVEADSPQEARRIATERLASGEELAIIDQILEV